MTSSNMQSQEGNCSDCAFPHGDKFEFLETILLHIPHMVFVKEAKELRFVLFNKAGEELLGVKNSDLIGCNDYDFFPKEQADFFTSADRRVLAGKTAVVIEEEPIDSPGLGRRYLRTKKVPIFDGQGQPLYLLGISEDITDIKHSRRLIEEQGQALAHSSKLSALGEMAGGIAHEINNPLSIILGLSSRLRVLQTHQKMTEEAIFETCNRLDSTVRRISHIIKALRAIARDGSQDPMVPCDLSQIIGDTLSLCAEKFRFAGIQVDFDRSAMEGITILGRMVEISQVLLNLLQNSFDAVSVIDEKWVRIEVEKVGDDALVRVTDSGKGIPPEFHGKLMQPFFTTKAIGKGTGLGLSISRAMIEGHGGMLKFNATCPNTCFEFSVPLKAAGDRTDAA